jgi:hypothetical protein
VNQAAAGAGSKEVAEAALAPAGARGAVAQSALLAVSGSAEALCLGWLEHQMLSCSFINKHVQFSKLMLAAQESKLSLGFNEGSSAEHCGARPHLFWKPFTHCE